MTGSMVRVMVLWLAAVPVLTAQQYKIAAGAKIFIEEMENDLDGYLKAELVKKKVKLLVVNSPAEADYIMTGSATDEQKRKWHAGWLTNEQDRTSANVVVLDKDTEQMVWAGEAGDRSLWWGTLARGGHRKVASRLVKNLKKAVMYAKGDGVLQDYAEAVKWYRLVADQGDAGAQFSLGRMYALGKGVPQDSQEAAKWFRLVADQGYASAQLHLGVLYALGKGVPQDDVQAHKWVNVAASRTGEEREKSVKTRDLVARRMTASQIAEAQRLAREWKPKMQEN